MKLLHLIVMKIGNLIDKVKYQVLANLKLTNTTIESWDDIDSNSKLQDAFDWDKSKEGRKYWEHIADNEDIFTKKKEDSPHIEIEVSNKQEFLKSMLEVQMKKEEELSDGFFYFRNEVTMDWEKKFLYHDLGEYFEYRYITIHSNEVNELDKGKLSFVAYRAKRIDKTISKEEAQILLNTLNLNYRYTIE